MGATPYYYLVDYKEDVEEALQELRACEFQAGRYNPVVPFPKFPVFPNSFAPGAQHDSIDEAMADAEEDGTRSILDVMRVSNEPDLSVAAPLRGPQLRALFGTEKPTHDDLIEKDIMRSGRFWEGIERGHCVYIVIYRDDVPDKLFFAGYSFD